jgi:hypothetical protein
VFHSDFNDTVASFCSKWHWLFPTVHDDYPLLGTTRLEWICSTIVTVRCSWVSPHAFKCCIFPALLHVLSCPANNDDLNVILWLSPQSPADTTQDASLAQDGLRIYDEASAGKLFSQGVSVYPSTHSDFLSRSSSLAIDLGARCNASQSEFVPRSPNRLVVVRSKKLCTLLTPGGPATSFDKATMIALVMTLTPTL